MPYFFTKSIVVLIMVLLHAVISAALSIKFESDTHDFGEVREGDMPEFSFQLMNSSTEDLVIQKIHPS